MGDGWASPVFGLRTFTNYSSSDYNGFRPNGAADNSFEWDSPPFSVLADYAGKLESRHFATLQAYSAATHEDTHSVLVDFNVFVRVAAPDKLDPQRLYNPEDFDFRLRAGSAAIDAAAELPTITDGFAGKAPDLGAYELGAALPIYGPRGKPPGLPAADAPRSVRGAPAEM